jgi:hypothetical protein
MIIKTCPIAYLRGKNGLNIFIAYFLFIEASIKIKNELGG